MFNRFQYRTKKPCYHRENRAIPL